MDTGSTSFSGILDWPIESCSRAELAACRRRRALWRERKGGIPELQQEGEFRGSRAASMIDRGIVALDEAARPLN